MINDSLAQMSTNKLGSAMINQPYVWNPLPVNTNNSPSSSQWLIKNDQICVPSTSMFSDATVSQKPAFNRPWWSFAPTNPYESHASPASHNYNQLFEAYQNLFNRNVFGPKQTVAPATDAYCHFWKRPNRATMWRMWDRFSPLLSKNQFPYGATSGMNDTCCAIHLNDTTKLTRRSTISETVRTNGRIDRTHRMTWKQRFAAVNLTKSNVRLGTRFDKAKMRGRNLKKFWYEGEMKRFAQSRTNETINVIMPTDSARAKIAKIPNLLGPYICQLCKQLFADAFKLAGHKCPCILHTDYRCPECDKIFNCPANLASHRRWHKPKIRSIGFDKLPQELLSEGSLTALSDWHNECVSAVTTGELHPSHDLLLSCFPMNLSRLQLEPKQEHFMNSCQGKMNIALSLTEKQNRHISAHCNSERIKQPEKHDRSLIYFSVDSILDRHVTQSNKCACFASHFCGSVKNHSVVDIVPPVEQLVHHRCGTVHADTRSRPSPTSHCN